MPEITDETIKKKHKEFNDRIKKVLDEVRGQSGNNFSPAIQKLRQARMKQPAFGR